MPLTAADSQLKPSVSAFRAAHTEATLRIVSAYSGHQINRIRRAAILFYPPYRPILRVARFADMIIAQSVRPDVWRGYLPDPIQP